MTFENIQIIPEILSALKAAGYEKPTPIQAQSIPLLLKGHDLLGCAQTGTGKTAAFTIPILQLLEENRKKRGQKSTDGIKALILTPTRELAIQISDCITQYSKSLRFRHATIFGGVSQVPQVDNIRKGLDIIVATPGRLLDLINQGHIKLNKLEFFVLDEADRMLDMGFVNDIKRIIPLLPAKRQNVFFSATMPVEIDSLAKNILKDPETVQVTPVSSTAETVKHSIYFVEKDNKKALLLHLLELKGIDNALLFTKTKHGADKVCKILNASGYRSEAIHGNKSQNARQNALKNFKDKKTKILVATDIAARGIDINDLQYVINFELPNVPETYIHRIGRTGRAGAKGIAMSFCDAEERAYLKDINKLLKTDVEIDEEHPYHSTISVRSQDKIVAKAAKRHGRHHQNRSSAAGSATKNSRSGGANTASKKFKKY